MAALNTNTGTKPEFTFKAAFWENMRAYLAATALIGIMAGAAYGKHLYDNSIDNKVNEPVKIHKIYPGKYKVV